MLSFSSCDVEEDNNQPDLDFLFGADLSYVNEMMDCGGTYRANGVEVDPYELFAEKGNDIVRLRLWHNPEWSGYSDFNDVKLAIERSKKMGMQILLDFHYSDEWADPGKQHVPQAWVEIDDLDVLGDSLYNYTFNTLEKLIEANLTPEIVQVGNETNSEILQFPGLEYDRINWDRNGFLLNRGLQAVRDASVQYDVEIKSMLHIAQPENAFWFFREAEESGVSDYDLIGLSYYPLWSEYSILRLDSAIRNLIDKYGKGVMIVETAYAHTTRNADAAGNILGTDSMLEEFLISANGQRDYMIALCQTMINAGGLGVIYWEPAWISTGCSTQWGVGSHWDNATFFDASNENEALPVFEFYDRSLYTD
jgi:arabinogalactan endo-1,4-beta-galactosidase